MSHDLIISLKYQLFIFQCLLDQLKTQLKGEPSTEEVQSLLKEIRAQRKIKNTLVQKAKFIEGMGNPSINMN